MEDGWLVRPPRALTAGLFVLAGVAMVGVGLLPFWMAERSSDARSAIQQIEAVRVPVDRLSTIFARQIAGIRGFALSGDTSFLHQFAESRAEESAVLGSLGPLTDRAHLDAAPTLSALSAAADAWHAMQDDLLRGAITERDFAAAVGLQQQRYDSLLALTNGLLRSLDAGIPRLNAEMRSFEVRQRWLSALASLAAFSCVLVLAWFAWRSARMAVALRNRERELVSTFENAAVGIVHVGLDGRWLRVNPRLCAILGRTPEELRDRTFQDLTHPADLTATLDLTQRMFAGEIPHFTIEQRYLRPDGSVVWCRNTASVSRRPDGTAEYAIAVLEDIDDRVRLESERSALLHSERDARMAAECEARRNRLLQDVTSALSVALRTEDVAGVVVDRVVATFGARYGFIALPTDDGASMEIVGPSRLPEPIPAEWSRFPMTLPIPLTRVFRTGTAEFIESGDDTPMLEPALASTLGQLGIRASAILPLRLGDRPIGAMTFDFVTPRRFDAAERELLGIVAQKVAQALDRAWLFAAERDRSREAQAAADRLDRLQGVTAALTGALTRGAVAAVLARQGRDALGGHAAAVALISADGASLEFCAWDGYPADEHASWQGLPLSAPTPLTESIRMDRAQWIGNKRAWVKRFGPVPRIARSVQSRAWATIPLVFQGRVLGGIAVSYPEARTFDEADRALGAAIAQLGAHALERARLYDEAEGARRAAEAGIRSRDRFLGATSHELRGPLTELIGSLDVLSESTGDGDGAAAQARAAAWRFAAIVDSMLVLADAESADARVHDEPVDVAAAARELVSAFLPVARARGIDVQVVAPDALVTSTNPRKLRPILYHLIDNALKFGNTGVIDVRVRSDGGELLVSVRDEGPGIPAERANEIFEPFTQLDGGHTRERGGAGIGLALARRFARHLGGDLTVASTPGTGSTFTLRLPARELPGVPDEVAQAAVLVVDDETPVRSVLLRLLRRDGFVVEGSSGSAEALERLEASSFQLVLTDISMPGRSGLWLADEIRRRWPLVPVVLMSGAELTADELAHAAKLGCPFISKPFDRHTLVAVLRRSIASGSLYAG